MRAVGIGIAAGETIGGYVLPEAAISFAHGSGPDGDVAIVLGVTQSDLSDASHFVFV